MADMQGDELGAGLVGSKRQGKEGDQEAGKGRRPLLLPALAPMVTYGTIGVSLLFGTACAYLDDGQYSPVTFLASTCFVWGVVALVVTYMVRHPPFRVYQGPAHAKLTDEIRGAARIVWGGMHADPKVDLGLGFEEVTVPVLDPDTLRPTHAFLRGWYVPVITKRLEETSSRQPADSQDGQSQGSGHTASRAREGGSEPQDASAPAQAAQAAAATVEAGAGGTTAIIMVHGAGRDRRAFLRHARSLHDHGYALLLCDLREHGLSFGEGSGVNYGPRECDDISSMAFWLRKHKDHTDVVVCGTSTGASAGIMAAARVRDENSPLYIKAVVAENPFASRRALFAMIARQFFRLPGQLDLLLSPYRRALVAIIYFVVSLHDPSFRREPIDCVADIAPRALFLMHSRADTTVPSWHTEELFMEAGDPKEIWLVDGASHAALYNHYPDQWTARVTTFLENVSRTAHAF